jgi:predicted phosphoadenosine phosphosulfate sulfurtransferase
MNQTDAQQRRLLKAKVYNPRLNVYEAALERLNFVFDRHEKIIVSLSGGKDSVTMLYLALEIARQRNRKIYAFWLDQEFEYNSTFLLIEELMKLEYVVPLWFQVHGILPTAISHEQYWLQPWNPAERGRWLRAYKRVSIKEITWPHDVPYSFPAEHKMGFYGLMKCMEQMFRDEDAAHLIGLRAEESLNRFRAVTRHPGVEGVPWSTRNRWGGVKYYPLYDWTFHDLWVYAGRNHLRYNKMYDYFWKKGYSLKEMRISSLMNRKAFGCLADIQEFEPRLYDALLERAQGVKTASLYADEGRMYQARKLPRAFDTWAAYRDFLLVTLPDRRHAEIFRERFAQQLDNEYVARQQVAQIQIHDLTNSRKIDNAPDPAIKRKQQWMDEL